MPIALFPFSMSSTPEKLVVLKLEGDFESQGFQVNLELGLEGKRPYAETSGTLPPAPNLILYLEQWQQQYRRLDLPNRIKPKEIIYGGGVDVFEKLLQLSYQLTEALKAWLESESFRPIDKLLREELNRNETIRVLLRSKNARLHRLPWHLWDFLERYPKAELALGAINFEQIKESNLEDTSESIWQSLSPIENVDDRAKVRILAILGNSDGIDTDEDCNLLKSLANTEVVFAIEPNRQELNFLLWDNSWNILFFAGHSETKQGKGQIYLNSEDSLTIEELRYGLRCAIAKGLQLAIFNSCDGLGLAYQLEQLNLPQVIVMREPIPDRVAQEFLKAFLRSFASGNSLYAATRIAREKLQGWENRFPCASWLPVIYQNPAVIPPSWQNLQKTSHQFNSIQSTSINSAAESLVREVKTQQKHKSLIKRIYSSIALQLKQIYQRSRWSSWVGILLVSLLVTNVIVGVRSLEMFQNLELAAFDREMQNRPAEVSDRRILVVSIDDRDINYQQKLAMQMPGSLSDEALSQLLLKILPYQPRAIGLDIYHDRPFPPELAKLVGQNQQFIGICNAQSRESDLNGITPPPNLSLSQLGFSDFPIDSDNVIRRQFIGMSPDSFCPTDRSFSFQLALLYLRDRKTDMTSQGLQLGNLLIKDLPGNAGGYQLNEETTKGYQILINYRSSPPPTISLRGLLQHPNNERLKELISDRIILIGVDLHNDDRFDTPYTPKKAPLRVPGVLVHAQMVSQIISAAVDGRSLLNWIPNFLEIFWIGCWSLLGGTLIYLGNLIFNSSYKFFYRFFAIAIVLFTQYLSCSILFCRGIWLPPIAPSIAIILTAVAIACNPFKIAVVKK
jgi:CHASE2 domain-containing sensor protein